MAFEDFILGKDRSNTCHMQYYESLRLLSPKEKKEKKEKTKEKDGDGEKKKKKSSKADDDGEKKKKKKKSKDYHDDHHTTNRFVSFHRAQTFAASMNCNEAKKKKILPFLASFFPHIFFPLENFHPSGVCFCVVKNTRTRILRRESVLKRYYGKERRRGREEYSATDDDYYNEDTLFEPCGGFDSNE